MGASRSLDACLEGMVAGGVGALAAIAALYTEARPETIANNAAEVLLNSKVN